MVEKKSTVVLNDNSSGVVSVVLGVQSIVFALLSPIVGIIFGIISMLFANNQSKKQFKGWSKLGNTLAIIGIIASIAFWVLTVTILAPYIQQYAAQAQG